MLWRVVVAAGLLTAGALAMAMASQREIVQSGQFQVGQPAPSLMLPDLVDGRPRSIEEFRGRKIILHVFASW